MNYEKLFDDNCSIFCCVTTVAVFTACTEDDNAVSTGSADIVGNWCADVSGLTYAKWNYGETWQNTEFKADGTGSTRIYYTLNGDDPTESSTLYNAPFSINATTTVKAIAVKDGVIFKISITKQPIKG